MANTPNIDLVKPAGTDHALVSVINSNSDKIDTFAGTTNAAIATLNSKITTIKTYEATATTNLNGVIAIPQNVCKPSKQILLAVYAGNGAYGYIRSDSIASDLYGFMVCNITTNGYTRITNTEVTYKIAYIDLS